MIHYDLRCVRDHAFDGWFPGSAAFDEQARRGLVACPVCGATEVTRALMAPAIGRRVKAPTQPASPVTPEPAPEAAPATAETTKAVLPAPTPPGLPMPDRMRAMLRELRQEVERRCEYVGPRLAEEARKIDTGEAPARGIYGEATPAEAEALRDDGIDLVSVPWVALTDD